VHALQPLARGAYLALAMCGRPFGGFRPFRVVNRLRELAWPEPPRSDEFWRVVDRWGCALRLHPYYLIDHNVIARGTYDAALHHYIERYVRPGMTVLDVGANIGSVALHMSRNVGQTGRVICFEPVPHVLARLRENVAANPFAANLLIEPMGVWSSSGTVDISVPPPLQSNHGCASIFRASDDATPVTISVTSLDHYAASRGLGRVDLIKFDIQGAEKAALQGAAKCLETLRPVILTEVSAKDLAAHNVTSGAYLASIERHGYTCARLRADGSIGEELRSEAVPEHAHYENVVCTPVERPMR
jgi:FkbM family methyltransferase